MGNHQGSANNQHHPTIQGHENAEVEYEWMGKPHMKGSRSRTYWFDRHGEFKSHRARDEAESIMRHIKSHSGV